MIFYIKTLSKYITRKLKLRLFFLLILMVFSSASEALSIASLIPFITVASSPKAEFENFFLTRIISFFPSNQSSSLLIFGLIFIVAIIFSSVFRLLTINFLFKTSAAFSFILSSKCF